MYCFRDNDIFLQTGIDVMVISPLGGVVHNFLNDLFWKGDPKFIIMFYRHVFPILNCLRIIRLFILAGISLLLAKLVEFSGEMTPKSQNF